jgi:uncharacterized protein
MKVTDDRKPIQDVAHGLGTANRRGVAGGAAPFGALLQEKGRADAKDTLNRLLERINEQGEIIAKRRDISDVRKYRELISDFLGEALQSSYRTDKEGSFDARGRFKEYAVVKKINAEVETLTRQVLDDQSDNLAILGQLGTIRGLLVDLLV